MREIYNGAGIDSETTVQRQAILSHTPASAQLSLTPLAALFCQIRVQLIPTVDAGNLNHEVPPHITDESFQILRLDDRTYPRTDSDSATPATAHAINPS